MKDGWLMNRLCRMCFLLCLALTACGEDDYHYPSVKLEFLTACSDAEGALVEVVTDEGRRYDIWAGASNLHIRPDSVIRIISNYDLIREGDTEGVRLYAVSGAIAPQPLPQEKFPDGIKTDPVDVVSIWMGYDYLNLILGVKAQSGKHQFHFVEDEVVLDAESRRSAVTLTLYHDDGGDVPAYTQRAYCSVPLSQYALDDVDVVEISFRVCVGTDEMKTYRFEYRPDKNRHEEAVE